ncbi:MAG: ATP-dependent DNA helicase [Eubacteriales bacterium]|nr:ATP-dependent DNA helicase [Eubacteriales bacterium]
MKPLNVSVRALVGFSLFPPDIMPVSSRLMAEGRAGHMARQAKSQARAEAALRWTGECGGVEVLVQGRMDLYDPAASPPLIEEIKLTGDILPQEASPEHLAQAACYGFMLCEKEDIPAAALRVSYVTAAGEEKAAFYKEMSREELRARFYELLIPYVRWQARLEALREARDASIISLPFPYPDYRPGQKEMAAQAYTAIARRKRLFAVMPTGTGKSAAVLYPAVKALAQGLCNQVFYLTARGTQRLAPRKELDRMAEKGLKAFGLTLYAREKLCPMEEVRCHPDHCPRAKGHYLRLGEALEEALGTYRWEREEVVAMADAHTLCPFEFSLSLCEIADVVTGDYNYAFDPRVRLIRVFDMPRGVALLVDEAHNLADRARDMLSGELSLPRLASARREAGKAYGRGSALYKAFTPLIRLLDKAEAAFLPDRLEAASGALIDALGGSRFPGVGDLARELIAFLQALRRGVDNEDYHLLWEPRPRSGQARIINLNPAPYLREMTARLAGSVYFSATLQPLRAMSGLLGGDKEDACLALPSPFPREHLLTLQYAVNTRYKAREGSLIPAARAIAALYKARPGKVIAYFPSFAYMRRVMEAIEAEAPNIPLVVQAPGMDETAREDFLSRFTGDNQPLLGLCVLGGVFAEGVDLPGEQLIAAAILGVGLPQVNQERPLYQARMEEAFQDGFGFAYRYPGMQKVCQAAGRLIRSENDRGVLLLMDDRFTQRGYLELLPEHIAMNRVHSIEDIHDAARDFWGDAPKEEP